MCQVSSLCARAFYCRIFDQFFEESQCWTLWTVYWSLWNFVCRSLTFLLSIAKLLPSHTNSHLWPRGPRMVESRICLWGRYFDGAGRFCELNCLILFFIICWGSCSLRAFLNALPMQWKALNPNCQTKLLHFICGILQKSITQRLNYKPISLGFFDTFWMKNEFLFDNSFIHNESLFDSSRQQTFF